MEITVYVPKIVDDTEQIKQKYISWVKSSNAVATKFKRDVDSCDILVRRVWKQYRSIDCNWIKVGATASEFSTTTYHVDAKIKGNKVYSDGQYDYYRKEDFEPAHDETSWDINTRSREITLSKSEGDKCLLEYGRDINASAKPYYDKFTVSDKNEISKHINSGTASYIMKLLDTFDMYVDCVDSISEEVEKKYKSLYPGTFKFTVATTSIHDLDIISQSVHIYPMYEISVKWRGIKYEGGVDSLEGARFTAPQFAPQSHDRPYKNYRNSIVLSSAMLLFLALSMALSSFLGHKGLMQMYIIPMALMSLLDVIFIILLGVQMRKKRPETILGQENRARSSAKWLRATVIVAVLLVVATALLYSVTSDDDFFYTPEIVGKYADHSGAYGDFEMTVQSCDEDGNVVIFHTFKVNYKSYNVVYNGQIVKKTVGKTVIKLSVAEYEKLPMSYRADDIITIEANSRYDTIKFDFITMKREQEQIPEDLGVAVNTEYASKVLGYYASIDKEQATVLHIISCTQDGKVEAEHIFVDKTAGAYSRQKLYGRVTDARQISVDISFDSGEWIKNWSGVASAEGTLVTISDEYGKCSFMNRELVHNSDRLYVIQSSDDFMKTKNSSGVFILASDIDFRGNTISPLGDFSGILLGNGYKIKNYNINEVVSDVGLFSEITKTATIADLCIEGASVTVSGKRTNVGLLSGLCYGNVFGVTVSGTVNAQDCERVGGVLGRLINGKALDVCANGVVVSGAEYVGGCVGNVYKSATSDLKADTNVTLNCSGQYCKAICGFEEK